MTYEYHELSYQQRRVKEAPKLTATEYGEIDGRAFRASRKYSNEDMVSFLKRHQDDGDHYTRGFCRGLRYGA